jgi:hypothetical protein
MLGSRAPDVKSGTGLCESSIRLEPSGKTGQKDTVYDNIVLRYVFTGKLSAIITIIIVTHWNLRSNQVDAWRFFHPIHIGISGNYFMDAATGR